MDWVTWVVIAGAIVIAAVGVAIWNRVVKRSSPVDRLDADAAKSIRDAQNQADRATNTGDWGNPGLG